MGMQQEGFFGSLFGASKPDIGQELANREVFNAQQNVFDAQRAQMAAEDVALGASKVIAQQGGVTSDPGLAYQQGQNAIAMAKAGYDPAAAFYPQTRQGQAEAQQAQQVQQQEMALAAQEQAMKQQEAQQAAEVDFINRVRPVRATGNAVSNVRDMKSLLANEGKIVAPGAAKGAYNSLRGFMLNDLRTLFEAGALQQAELEFFSSMLPDATAWMSISQDERMAALNELEFQMQTRLDDQLAFSRTGLTGDQVTRPTRGWQDIVGKPVPGGYEEMQPEQPVPTGPSGSLSPFSGFLQQLGL